MKDLLDARPARARLTGLLGAACWLASLQFFLAEAATTLGWPGHYSYRDNYISDLGAATCGRVCSPWHTLMNASFVTQGVLIAAGALLLPRRLSPGATGVLARAALIFAALGVAVVGFAPEDINLNVHIMGARTHFLASTLAMLFWGLALVFSRQKTVGLPRALRTGSPALLAFGVAAFGDVLLVLGNAQTAAMLGGGIVERLAAYPLPLWLAWTGAAAGRTLRQGGPHLRPLHPRRGRK